MRFCAWDLEFVVWDFEFLVFQNLDFGFGFWICRLVFRFWSSEIGNLILWFLERDLEFEIWV